MFRTSVAIFLFNFRLDPNTILKSDDDIILKAYLLILQCRLQKIYLGVIMFNKNLWFMAFIRHAHDLFVHKYGKTNSIFELPCFFFFFFLNYRIKSIHTQNATIEYSKIKHSFILNSFPVVNTQIHTLCVPLLVATMHWMWRYAISFAFWIWGYVAI